MGRLWTIQVALLSSQDFFSCMRTGWSMEAGSAGDDKFGACTATKKGLGRGGKIMWAGGFDR